MEFFHTIDVNRTLRTTTAQVVQLGENRHSLPPPGTRSLAMPALAGILLTPAHRATPWPPLGRACRNLPSEPSIDRGEKVASLRPLTLTLPQPGPCSSPPAAPRTSRLAARGATASPRSKQASAFAASPRLRRSDINVISPAMRWMFASFHLSLVASTAAIASSMQRQASSKIELGIGPRHRIDQQYPHPVR